MSISNQVNAQQPFREEGKPGKYRINGKKIISFLGRDECNAAGSAESLSTSKGTPKDRSCKSSSRSTDRNKIKKNCRLIYGGGTVCQDDPHANGGSITQNLRAGQSAESSNSSITPSSKPRGGGARRDPNPMNIVDELSVPDDTSEDGCKERSYPQGSSTSGFTNSAASVGNEGGGEFQLLVDKLIDMAAARKYLLETQLLSNEDHIVQGLYNEMGKVINYLKCGGREAYSVIGCDRASLETTFERLLIRRNEREYYEELYIQILGILNQLLEYWRTDESQSTIAMELLHDSCLKEMEPMCEGVRFIVKHLLLPENTCLDECSKERIKKMYQTLLDIVRSNKLKWVNLAKATKQPF